MTKTFAISPKKTPRPRMATPSASFPPSPAAVVVVNPPDPGGPLSRFESRSEISFRSAFLIFWGNPEGQGNDRYDHSNADGQETGCRAIQRRNSPLQPPSHHAWSR